MTSSTPPAATWPAPEPRPAASLPRWVVPVVVLLAAALLGLGTGVAVTAQRQAGPRREAAAAVERWLQAVADGRVDDALAMSHPLAAGDATFLSAGEVAGARAALPVSDLAVAPVDATHAEASWTVGGERMTGLVEVTTGSDPRVVTGAAQASFLGSSPLAPLRIGGRLPGKLVLLLPGAYPVSSSSPHLTYGDGVLRVLPGESRVDTSSLTPQVSESGRQALRSAVEASLAACLAQQSLHPAGCPNAYDSPADEGLSWSTIGWALDGGLPDLGPIDATDPSRATAELDATLVLTATGKAGPVRHEVTTRLRPLADLTRDEVTVRWS